MWVVSFTPRPLCTQGKSLRYPFEGGWVGPRASLNEVENRKFLTLSRLKIQPLGRPARSHSLYRTHYLGSLSYPYKEYTESHSEKDEARSWITRENIKQYRQELTHILPKSGPMKCHSLFNIYTVSLIVTLIFYIKLYIKYRPIWKQRGKRCELQQKRGWKFGELNLSTIGFF
jgi:hypothetical protein